MFSPPLSLLIITHLRHSSSLSFHPFTLCDAVSCSFLLFASLKPLLATPSSSPLLLPFPSLPPFSSYPSPLLLPFCSPLLFFSSFPSFLSISLLHLTWCWAGGSYVCFFFFANFSQYFLLCFFLVFVFFPFRVLSQSFYLCLSVFLSIGLSVFIHIFTYLPIYICSSVCLSFSLVVCLSACL